MTRRKDFFPTLSAGSLWHHWAAIMFPCRIISVEEVLAPGFWSYHEYTSTLFSFFGTDLLSLYLSRTCIVHAVSNAATADEPSLLSPSLRRRIESWFSWRWWYFTFNNCRSVWSEVSLLFSSVPIFLKESIKDRGNQRSRRTPGPFSFWG